MRYNGRIELGKELTFSQAKAIQDHIQKHQINLEISKDGRAIQWDGTECTCLENPIADLMHRFINPMNFKAQGVIIAASKNKHYEIVVLKKMVKVHIDGDIVDVLPSPKTNQK